MDTAPSGLFTDSKSVRHGTANGHAKHLNENTPPCEPCRIAKSQYDQRQLDIPENVTRNRIGAKAQSLAFRELRTAHEEEYRVLYQKNRDALLDEAGLKRRSRQNFKTVTGKSW